MKIIDLGLGRIGINTVKINKVHVTTLGRNDFANPAGNTFVYCFNCSQFRRLLQACVLASDIDKPKTPYRSRYAPELHPGAARRKVDYKLSKCNNLESDESEIFCLLTAYAAVLPCGLKLDGLIERRNKYLEGLLDTEEVHKRINLAAAFYLTVNDNLFARIDELDTCEWNGEVDEGVQKTYLPMLWIIRKMFVGKISNSLLLALFTSPEFAGNLMKLLISPIAEEREAVMLTMGAIINEFHNCDNEARTNVFIAAVKSIEKCLSKVKNDDRDERYRILLNSCWCWIERLPTKAVVNYLKEYLEQTLRCNRNATLQSLLVESLLARAKRATDLPEVYEDLLRVNPQSAEVCKDFAHMNLQSNEEQEAQSGIRYLTEICQGIARMNLQPNEAQFGACAEFNDQTSKLN